MNGPQTTYPDFVPNQLLTSTQLNDLRVHLDRQDRAGRSKLTGMGIICGLTFKREGNANARKVVLSEGLGLTSDGYVVCVPGDTFGHVRGYIDPATTSNGRTPQYKPWRTSPSGVQRPISELVSVPAGESVPTGVRVLRQADLAGRVLVLYVELAPVELRSCFVTECDNKGRKIEVTIRALLVRQTHLSPVPGCERPLPRVRVRRLHTVKDLAALVGTADIDAGYRVIVEEVMPGLVDRITEAFKKFGAHLELDEATHLGPVASKFRSAVLKGDKIHQYHYDAVREMAAAYNEFVGAACGLIIPCCPDRDFPRHLMLGGFGAAPGFRHPFHPSSVRNVVRDDYERTRKLFLRMTALADSIDFAAAAGIRLRPSHTEEEPLGARAVPHYFPLPTEATGLWQPELCCTTDDLWSYHDARKALDFDDYNRSGLIRIEGHRGQACTTARGEIARLRKARNAEFHLLLTSFDVPDLEGPAKKIEELLAARAGPVAEIRRLVAIAIATGKLDPDPLRKVISSLEGNDVEIGKHLEVWSARRCGRVLHCDTTHLEMLYTAVRNELLCLLTGTLAELSAITDAAAALGDQLGDHARDLLLILPGRLRGLTRRIVDVAMPPRLCGFNFPGFIALYKELIEDLTQLWLWWRSLGFPIQGAELETVVDRPWPPGGESVSAALLAAARGCHHTRLARVFGAFEQIWTNDPSYFPNLVKAVDGLEHLAGVRRCGTFVLVCDERSPPRVAADFSLSCRLPCCCEVAEECLPVVALPHHRVVRLVEKADNEFERVQIRIDLTTAGYDPNFGGKGEAPPLTVDLKVPFDTPMGGRVDKNQKGVLQYRHDRPKPGMLDSFEYALVSGHECGGSDKALVSILFEPPPRVPDQAPPKGGVVTGHVTLRGKPIDSSGIRVRIVDPVEDIPVGTGPAGELGFYRSRPLPAGTYKIFAFYEDFYSDEVAVIVSAGKETQQDLDMTPRNGRVEVLVLDPKKSPIDHSAVSLLNANKTVHATSKQPVQGVHKFENVPVGMYSAYASATRFIPSTVDYVKVQSRQSTVHAVELGQITISVPDRYVYHIALDTGEEAETFRARAGKLYGDRYMAREAGVTKAGKTAALASTPAYRSSVEFVEKYITNEKVPADSLAKAYGKVAGSLTRSIAHPASNAAKKKALRSVLVDVTSAYLDRITIDQPEELSAAVARSVELAASSLERGGVKPTTFKSSWKSAELSEQLSSKIATKIEGMIG